MSIDPASVSAQQVELTREVLMLKKHKDVQQQVAQSLVDLVQSAPAPPAEPGRLSVYA